jgi:hypothetical protein
MIYKWKTGTSEIYNKFDAQTVGENLEVVSAKHGELSPDVIVEAASNVESPLHHLFEWNDSVAAKGFRHLQAEEISQSIVSVRLDAGKPLDESPKFLRVISKPRESRNMSDVAVAASRSHSKIEQINSAMFELKKWYERFECTKGLSSMLDALRLHWPDCGIDPPKERFAVRASAMLPQRKPVLNWCAVCLQDHMRIQAIREVSTIPLCKPCVEAYSDEPEILKQALEFMSTLSTA